MQRDQEWDEWSSASGSFESQIGLPGVTVQAFAQTPDGYLWVGTSEGLFRYDGANLEHFSHENTPAMREDSVFCLLAARMEGCGLALTAAV